MPAVVYRATKREKLPMQPLGGADQAILLAINRYYVLTAMHVAQLLYQPTASGLRYAQRRLKRLADSGYLQAEDQPKLARYGTAPQVYFLANDGRQYLAHVGVPVDRRSRPEAVGKYRFLFYQHALEANAVGIALERLTRLTARVELVELRSEHVIKRRPAKVRLPSGESVSVYPDAWYDLVERDAQGAGYQTCLALELDRGTENKSKWARKIAALVAWSKEPYQTLYGTDSLTICVLTTDGPRRCQQLIGWTAATLTELGAAAAADLFRFTAQTPEDTDPPTLFFGPVWSTPFAATPTALLEVAGGSP